MTLKDMMDNLMNNLDKLDEVKPPTKFVKLLDQYEEKFKSRVPNEPSSFSEEEWCDIIEECLEKNITVEEMFGMDYETEIY